MAGLWKVYNLSVKEQILDLQCCRQRLYLCTATDNKRKIKINGDFHNMKSAMKDHRVQSSLCDDEAAVLLSFAVFVSFCLLACLCSITFL